MATKSSNTQGNPYHDEEGKFTTANGSSTSVKEGEGKLFSIRLKPNFDINAAKQGLQKAKISSQQSASQQIGSYKEATNIEEANAIGQSILPSCRVNYSNKCDVAKANEMNKALSDVANKFPGFVQNGLLAAFGDGISMQNEELKTVIVQSALNVVKNDKFFSKLYDEFFEISKNRYELNDEDKYNEQVFSHFMGFDRDFDFNDYTRSFYGGGALAYYQVSMKNIFNPPSGGKGISGAIKFYPEIMGKPTQKEISDNNYAVKTGFHFDYGEHNYTYGTGVHELGHSIFTIAFKKCTDEERVEINKILQEGSSTGKESNQVSGYGHHSWYEQEAEAVADVFCRGANATPHNKKMFAWLEKVHNRLKKGGEI